MEDSRLGTSLPAAILPISLRSEGGERLSRLLALSPYISGVNMMKRRKGWAHEQGWWLVCKSVNKSEKLWEESTVGIKKSSLCFE
jgi:hypothetical protein